MSGAVLYDYTVEHPEYGVIVVSSIGPDSATLAAAKAWGARWQEIAWECTARRGGVSRRPRCRRCGREFGEAGTVGVYCLDCRRAEEAFRREAARRGGPRERRGEDD